jgi:DNA-binding protein H-NS
MTFDLNSMSRKDLEKLRVDIDKALVKRAQDDLKTARLEIEKVAEIHGFSIEELTAAPLERVVRTRGKVAPKYRSPHDPELVWTGRGRKPLWVVAVLAEGYKLEDILI